MTNQTILATISTAVAYETLADATDAARAEWNKRDVDYRRRRAMYEEDVD